MANETITFAHINDNISKPFDAKKKAAIFNRVSKDLVFESGKKSGIKRTDLRQLLMDEEVSACYEKRLAAIRSVAFKLEGKMGKELNVEQADECFSSLLKVKGRQIEAAMEAKLFGYSVYNVLHYLDVNKSFAGFAEVIPMRFEDYAFNDELLIGPRDETKASEFKLSVQEFKVAHCVYKQSINKPHGEPFLALIHGPWLHRQSTMQDWAIVSERFAMPFLHGKTSSPATQVEGKPPGYSFAHAMAEGLDSASRGSAIVTGTDDSVDLLDSSVQNSTFFESRLRFINESIQRIFLGQTLTSSNNGVGSFAAAKVHNEVRHEIRDSDLEFVKDSFQHLVDAFWSLKKYTTEVPVFAWDIEQGYNEALALRDASLVPVLAQSDLAFSPQYFAENYKLDDVYLVPKVTPASSPSFLQEKLAEWSSFKAQSGVAAIDYLQAKSVEFNLSPIDPKLIKQALSQSATEAEFIDRLEELTLQSSGDKFAEFFSSAELLASVQGFLAAVR